MDSDSNYSIFFWTDYIATPQWAKRMYQLDCYQCKQAPITKSSPHCHLCGLLFCQACVSHVHLPQRFNLKKRPFGPFSACSNCVEQVSARRLSILSEMAAVMKTSLNNFADLAVVQNNVILQNANTPAEINFGVVETPGKTVVSEAFSPQSTLLHSFLGLDINTTLKQLYSSIYHSSTQQHLMSISILLDGKIIPIDQLSKITLQQLLPLAHVATIQQVDEFNSNSPDFPAPTPANFAKLLKERDEKRKAEKRAKRQSSTTNDASASNNSFNNSLGAIDETRAEVESGSAQIDTNPATARERSQSPNRRSRRESSRGVSKSRTRDASVSRSGRSKDKEGTDNWYMALHSYVNTKPQSDDKSSKILSFAKGDRLRITNQASPDWWYAVTEDNCQKGWIPASYVAPQDEVIKKLKEKQKARAEKKAAQVAAAGGV